MAWKFSNYYIPANTGYQLALLSDHLTFFFILVF